MPSRYIWRDKSGKLIMLCPLCGNLYDSTFSLFRHLHIRHIPDLLALHYCVCCGLEFRGWSRYHKIAHARRKMAEGSECHKHLYRVAVFDRRELRYDDYERRYEEFVKSVKWLHEKLVEKGMPPVGKDGHDLYLYFIFHKVVIEGDGGEHK